MMRYTEKRNGKNVIPLRNAVCGVDLPKWSIHKKSDIQSFLSGDAVDRLAEIEDKIENGTLIELPCKVGDTVYVIIKAENGYALLKDICDGFMIKDGEVYIGLQTYNVGANKYYFTREDAEKRLEELQNG